MEKMKEMKRIKDRKKKMMIKKEGFGPLLILFKDVDNLDFTFIKRILFLIYDYEYIYRNDCTLPYQVISDTNIYNDGKCATSSIN